MFPLNAHSIEYSFLPRGPFAHKTCKTAEGQIMSPNLILPCHERNESTQHMFCGDTEKLPQNRHQIQ